ncbi:MAG TPA: sulfatase-like hydrolase/transferase [Terriglobales bacterium]|jgi:choline-sulfatase|nr:sulfatase-like hydrolase/transferase [Terriglobales bacterium]
MRRLALGFLTLALLTSAWGQAAAVRSASPDVFLVTIDTLRADHVGCYGYKQIETPALDGLAADGIRFEHAFTHSPITNTSHTSILTGLLPSAHGVTDFGVPLAPQHTTWAELLKKKGYQTAAFIGAVILDSSTLAPGLDRGFDFYDNFPAKTDNKERFGRVERRGMDVVQHAQSWLDKHRTGPRFVWVHLFDPHDPYEPPPPYSEKYKNPYDGEIAYADSALANFIAYLKKTGAYSNAIIVVVGDHGEGLGEHGEETHGLFLYDSTLHVPMILKMKVTGADQRGMVVDAQVRTTDILPTILSLTNISAPPELSGESMIPLIEKQTASHDLLAETDYPLRFGWAPLKALRAGGVKLIDAPRPELYDLKADPGELKNLYSADSEQAKGMQAELAKWKARAGVDDSAKSATPLPDPKDKIEVQNLLHRSMLASDDNRSTDARGFLEKALELDPTSPTTLRQLGENELAAGDFAKAAVHLKKAQEVRPEDSTAAFELGQALEKTGDFAGARDALEASLKMVPSQMPARLLLGRVYLQLKDAKNAQDQFEAASLVDSNNVEARLGLAEAQIQLSDFAGALPDLEALTKGDTTNAAAFRLLAQAYRGLGRAADAQRAEAKAAATGKK